MSGIQENNAAIVQATGPKKRRSPIRQPDLIAEECWRIKAHLMTLACTEVWVESIMQLLISRDRRGRLLIRYEVDPRGRLRTKMPRLLEMIADAYVYPPACDDQAWGDP